MTSLSTTEPSDPYLAPLTSLLSANGVKVAFNGHTHTYQRIVPSSGGLANYVLGGGGGVLEPVDTNTICKAVTSSSSVYAIGWSPSSGKGTACGAPAPTSAMQVYSFAKVTVSGTTVTVQAENANGQVFDTQTFAYGSPTDTTKPSVPTGLATTTVASSSVGLTWQPSTDNVGVTGYDVYRNGTLIGTSPTSSYTDSTVASGTSYQYTVAAFDAAKNISTQSSPALSITTPPSTTAGPRVLQTVSANTKTVTFSPTTAGDTLVLGASLYTGTTNNITSVTDSAGDAWHKIGAASVSGHNSDGELWYASGVPAGVTSITATTAATSLALQAQEISGVSSVEGSSLASDTSAAAASGPITPSSSGRLGVCLVAGHASAQSITLGSGWTAPISQQESAGTGIATVLLGDQVTGTATLTCSGSFSATMYWAAGLAVLK